MKSLEMYDGSNITPGIKEFAQRILDGKVTVEFEVDYSDCYYESDAPYYRLVIKEK